MKKFLGVLFLASGLLSFTACSGEESDGPEPDVIWDIAPFVIHITVSDKDGNDLLNPETSQSIADNGIKAIWTGRTFEKDSILSPMVSLGLFLLFSEACMPINGLTAVTGFRSANLRATGIMTPRNW